MKNLTTKKRAYSAVALLTASTLLTPALASAQVVPGSVRPERVEERFRQPQVEPQQPSTAVPNIQVPQTAVSGKLAQKFTLRQVVIDDSTVYPAGTFDALYKDKIGQTITLAHAREMARAITARYRTDGYVLSQAVIPNQNLSNGVLHIRVVEGFVDKVFVENDRPNSDRRNLIAGYAEHIKAQHPLNTKTLERYMLLIDDLPGVKARAIIKPSPSTFGAADLIIQVTNKVIDASFTSDNRGNKFLGPYQEQLTLSENSALGLGERTTIRGINTIPTRDLHFFDIQNEEQIGSEGTKVILLAAFTQTHPGDSLSALDIRGTSEDYAITVTHPFLRSRAANFTGRVTFDARDSENDILGTRISNDRVRALRVGGDFNTGDRFDGVDLIDGSVSQGLPWLNATEGLESSRPLGGEKDFTKFNLDLSRLQNLPHGFSFLTSATGQYSNHPLFTSEQFTLGGVGFGQAYDTGEIAGDSGIAGRLELRYGQPLGYQFFDSYQLYGYYDIGSVFLQEQGPGVQSQASLSDVGIGIRANFAPFLYGYAEVGFPLTRDVASEGNRDPRFFFSVTARY